MSGDEKGETDGCEAFERVYEKYGVAPAFPENAQNICGADIAAADSTNIDAVKASDEISRWERSKQVP
jgi:hypothetical protein